jgi:hypothetical protein
MSSVDVFTDLTNINFTRSKDQVFTDLQGEIVVLNVKSGKYYSLNTVGSLIWREIEHPNTFRSIVNAILGEYNVESQRCEEDVRNLLWKLHQADLIEIHNVKPIDTPDLQ